MRLSRRSEARSQGACESISTTTLGREVSRLRGIEASDDERDVVLERAIAAPSREIVENRSSDPRGIDLRRFEPAAHMLSIEELARAVSRLGDPVGVKEDEIARIETRLRVRVGGVLGEPEHDAVAADF